MAPSATSLVCVYGFDLTRGAVVELQVLVCECIRSEVAAASSPPKAHRIAVGLSKCAAPFLCAAPVVRAFTNGEGTFTRSLQRYNGITPVQTPHAHHCGARGEKVLASSDWVHLNNCACLGGNIRPHNPPVRGGVGGPTHGGALGCPRGSLEGGYHVHGL